MVAVEVVVNVTGVRKEIYLGLSQESIKNTGEKTHKGGTQPGFEIQGKRHHKSNTGVSVAKQKALMSSKILFKERDPCVPPTGLKDKLCEKQVQLIS